MFRRSQEHEEVVPKVQFHVYDDEKREGVTEADASNRISPEYEDVSHIVRDSNAYQITQNSAYRASNKH